MANNKQINTYRLSLGFFLSCFLIKIMLLHIHFYHHHHCTNDSVRFIVLFKSLNARITCTYNMYIVYVRMTSIVNENQTKKKVKSVSQLIFISYSVYEIDSRFFVLECTDITRQTKPLYIKYIVIFLCCAQVINANKNDGRNKKK